MSKFENNEWHPKFMLNAIYYSVICINNKTVYILS